MGEPVTLSHPSGDRGPSVKTGESTNGSHRRVLGDALPAFAGGG